MIVTVYERERKDRTPTVYEVGLKWNDDIIYKEYYFNESEALAMCKDLNNIVLEFLQNETSLKYKGSKVVLKRR